MKMSKYGQATTPFVRRRKLKRLSLTHPSPLYAVSLLRGRYQPLEKMVVTRWSLQQQGKDRKINKDAS